MFYISLSIIQDIFLFCLVFLHTFSSGTLYICLLILEFAWAVAPIHHVCYLMLFHFMKIVAIDAI